jgi:hypothetical protein
LSPVFNIRGATNIPGYPGIEGEFRYSVYEDFYVNELPLEEVLKKIDYAEEDYMIIGGKAPNENAKGVI